MTKESTMTSVGESAAALLGRELRALRLELEAYPDDETVWATPGGLRNSAGTLALHIAGNLRHFVGAVLGQNGYRRDRRREFDIRGLTRAQLLEEVTEAERAVRTVLPAIDDADMAAVFPETLFGLSLQTGDLVMHLCSHLAYHLGQIDYHRRLVTGQTDGVGALPLTELSSARPAGASS
jgi:hypothetical protein